MSLNTVIRAIQVECQSSNSTCSSAKQKKRHRDELTNKGESRDTHVPGSEDSVPSRLAIDQQL